MKKFFKQTLLLLNKFFFPFYKDKEIKILFYNLEKNESFEKEVAMFVGGCVRNFLQSKKIVDIDIATIFTPLEIKKKLKNTNFKVIDTGIDHGSVTVILNDKKFELTTLRKDIKTDGRHAEVKLINDWEEDSKRRDFTINAIYLNKRGKIFDPQQGVNDLKNGVVKFIGDPQTRIEEDFLRIIRFVRFSMQYNSLIEQSTVNAIKLNLNGIKKISKERVLLEIFKILKLPNFCKINENKQIREIFSIIFPEFINLNRLKNFEIIKGCIKSSELLFLSILLIDLKSNYEYFCHKYKISNKIKEELSLLGANFKIFNSDKEFFKKKLKSNLYYLGANNMKILYSLNLLNKKKFSKKEIELFKFIDNLSIPQFPYDGKTLIKKGFMEGNKIGKILDEAEKFWIQNDFNISSDEFEKIVKNNSSLN